MDRLSSVLGLAIVELCEEDAHRFQCFSRREGLIHGRDCRTVDRSGPEQSRRSAPEAARWNSASAVITGYPAWAGVRRGPCPIAADYPDRYRVVSRVPRHLHDHLRRAQMPGTRRAWPTGWRSPDWSGEAQEDFDVGAPAMATSPESRLTSRRKRVVRSARPPT